MADIQLKYRGQLAALTSVAGEQIQAASVKEALKSIKARFGAEAEKKAKTMVIAVNGESILHLKHFNTVLSDGDEVAFLPICGGG